ncbi:hypothetical protein ACGFJ5_19590 [Micromonospora echinaurantiaca]|uniref:hypothetical protein n=1 Tax=Micromonospora echinaurantiaca TaxID=47857 RepID=UPI00371A01B7
MSQRPYRSALAGVGTVSTAPIAALIINAASDHARWPGPLDYLRQYSWPALAVAVAAAVILHLLDRRTIAEASDVGHSSVHNTMITGSNLADARDNSGQSLHLSGAIFNGPVTISQGDAGQQIGNPQDMPAADVPVKPAEQVAANQHPIILYHVSAFLAEGMWEEKAISITRSVSREILCLPLGDRNIGAPNVAAILVILSAGQYTAVKRKAVAKLKAARTTHPFARVILIAAGLSDEPVRVEEGHALLRQAGYDIDDTRFLACATEEELEPSLSSQIRVTIEVSNMQSKLEQSQRSGNTSRETDQ